MSLQGHYIYLKWKFLVIVIKWHDTGFISPFIFHKASVIGKALLKFPKTNAKLVSNLKRIILHHSIRSTDLSVAISYQCCMSLQGHYIYLKWEFLVIVIKCYDTVVIRHLILHKASVIGKALLTFPKNNAKLVSNLQGIILHSRKFNVFPYY